MSISSNLFAFPLCSVISTGVLMAWGKLTAEVFSSIQSFSEIARPM